MKTGTGRTRRSVLAVAALALLLGACFKTDAKSVVAADGSAASRMTIEIDLGFFENVFGGFADGFAEEFGGGPGDDIAEEMSITEQFEESAREMEAEVERLYAEHPELRDRFQLAATVEDETFILEMAVVTETAEALEALYDSFLGSGDADFRDIIGVDADFGDPTDDMGAGGGMGIFSTVSVTLGDRFEFLAEPISAELSTDDEFGGMEGFFEGLAPEITVEITAPGDIVSTNGERDGRTVRWELNGTDGEGIELLSEVDASVTIDGLSAIGSIGDDDGGTRVGMVVLAVAAVLGAGAALYLRSRRSTEPEPAVNPAPSAFPAGPPSVPPSPTAPPSPPEPPVPPAPGDQDPPLE